MGTLFAAFAITVGAVIAGNAGWALAKRVAKTAQKKAAKRNTTSGG